MSLLKLALGAVGLASTVAGHGYVMGVQCNGQKYERMEMLFSAATPFIRMKWFNIISSSGCISPSPFIHRHITMLFPTEEIC